MCAQCKGRHKANHRTVVYITAEEENHIRSINGEFLSGVQSDSLNCPQHKFDFYSRYCYTDEKPICEKCFEMEPKEKGAGTYGE